MLQFNMRDNSETSEFELFWNTAVREIETESTHGARVRRYTTGEFDTTNSIPHAPFTSTKNLIKCTIHILEKG